METAFLNFSEDSLKIIQLAQQAAGELGHSITGSEHILLGILSNQDCRPTKVLLSMGITYRKVEEEVLRLQKRNSSDDIRPFEFTPRAKAIIEMSVKANERTESKSIEPEDIFIAILSVPRCTAQKIIHALDIDEELILTRLTSRAIKPSYSDTTIDQLAELQNRIQSGSFGSEEPEEDNSPDPMIGYVIDDKYQIEEVIGRGGMGVVYRVKHKLLDRHFAVKILHPYLASDAQNKRRFQREAQAASRLTHPNVATVFDWDLLDDGRPYLVMYYIEGVKLSDIIHAEEQNQIPLTTWISILNQICDALGHAHEQGVIHRDLKPGNIVLSKSNKLSHFIKIVDFGIAKILQDTKEAKQLTKTGEVFGSPLYMSPEQCLGKAIDNRSDVYAMGCVMYEIFTGLPPFYGDSVYNTMRSHVTDKPKKLIPCQLFPKVPPELEFVILKCLSKNPDDRPETMERVKSLLENINQNILKEN